MESALNKWVVMKHRLYIFIQAVLENLFYCFPTKKRCSFLDVYKSGFRMTSSVFMWHLNLAK